MKTIIPFFMLITFVQCGESNLIIEPIINDEEIPLEINLKQDSIPLIIKPLKRIEDRTLIVERLKNKIENKEALLVHIYVPLCDNENQGIIPTSESLGNGMDLKRNLYWAVSKGVKRFGSTEFSVGLLSLLTYGRRIF